MIEFDKKRLAKVLMTCSEIYGRETTSGLLDAFYLTLQDFDINLVEKAFSDHLRDIDRGRFFPKPADLIEKLTGGSREQAVTAWAEVRLLASNSRIAKSENPITEAVVGQMGGWRKLGLTDVTEFQWLEKEFTERYQILSKRPELVEEAMVKIKSNVTKMFPSNDH